MMLMNLHAYQQQLQELGLLTTVQAAAQKFNAAVSETASKIWNEGVLNRPYIHVFDQFDPNVDHKCYTAQNQDLICIDRKQNPNFTNSGQDITQIVFQQAIGSLQKKTISEYNDEGALVKDVATITGYTP